MQQIDYRFYKLSWTEYLIYGCIYLFISAIISILFYNALFPVFLFLLFLKFFYRFVSSYLCQKRKNTLIIQFRDMINSISVSLNSGYSIENSIRETYQEIKILYGTDSYIYSELNIMLRKLALNVPIEIIFYEFAQRSDCDDIIMFSQILNITKRNGGDLISIIKTSAETIGEKIDIQREIATSIAAKKFEQNIMFCMPPVIMLYIRLFSKDFFSPVYYNIPGIILMSFCLILYIASIFLGLKISTIKN